MACLYLQQGCRLSPVNLRTPPVYTFPPQPPEVLEMPRMNLCFLQMQIFVLRNFDDFLNPVERYAWTAWNRICEDNSSLFRNSASLLMIAICVCVRNWCELMSAFGWVPMLLSDRQTDRTFLREGGNNFTCISRRYEVLVILVNILECDAM